MDIKKPLEGVKVIELGIYVAGPSSASILGYLGADVIRVEPIKGDTYRRSGIGFGMPAEDEKNPLFDATNLCKRCISLDFRTDDGKKVMHRLVEDADIFITNYRSKALAGMACTYEEFKAINPQLVYGQLSGYGERGPDKEEPGFDGVAFFARSGFTRSAVYDDAPPMMNPTGAGDKTAGFALAVGLLAAYIKAKETGAGEKVSTSLYATGLWVMASNFSMAQFAPPLPSLWEKPLFLAIAHDYKCADGVWLRTTSLSVEQHWAPICRAFHMEEEIDNELFNTTAAQHDNVAACVKLLQEKIIRRPYAYWNNRLIEHDVPHAPSLHPRNIINDAQAQANNLFDKLEYPDGEAFLPSVPIHLQSVKEYTDTTTVRERGPKLGQHTREILEQHGFSAPEIERLLETKAVKQYPN